MPPAHLAGRRTNDRGKCSMMFWPAVTLLGFLVLTGLVIVMGSSSTARYEREKSAASAPRVQSAPEPMAATAGTA